MKYAVRMLILVVGLLCALQAIAAPVAPFQDGAPPPPWIHNVAPVGPLQDGAPPPPWLHKAGPAGPLQDGAPPPPWLA